MSELYFISGINTDAGKSFATGWLAKTLEKEGRRVATVKPIQTGNVGYSEDIAIHRAIMGHSLPEDDDLLTSPQIFSYPASPHLATRIDGRELDINKIDEAIAELAKTYDVVLIEGAGGLMVPLTDEMFTIEFPQQRDIPVYLVTNGALGSINHTVLSLEALGRRGMKFAGILYNAHFDNDKIISEDCRDFLKRYLKKHWPAATWIEIPSINI